MTVVRCWRERSQASPHAERMRGPAPLPGRAGIAGEKRSEPLASPRPAGPTRSAVRIWRAWLLDTPGETGAAAPEDSHAALWTGSPAEPAGREAERALACTQDDVWLERRDPSHDVVAAHPEGCARHDHPAGKGLSTSTASRRVLRCAQHEVGGKERLRQQHDMAVASGRRPQEPALPERGAFPQRDVVVGEPPRARRTGATGRGHGRALTARSIAGLLGAVRGQSRPYGRMTLLAVRRMRGGCGR
jgi:hypothetical protein